MFNPLAVCNCDKDNSSKPPCKYIARWDCDVRIDDNDGKQISHEWLVNADMSFRQLCEFGPAGEYVGCVGDPFTGAVTDFRTIEANAYWPYACTISQRYNLQTRGAASAAAFAFVRSMVRWTLIITGSLPTLTHSNGLQYVGIGKWDCFGPNTLTQVANTAAAAQARIPKRVCITPEIVTAVPRPQCCNNFFQATFVQSINYRNTVIEAQRLEFLPIPVVQPGYVCEYFAQIKIYGHVLNSFSGIDELFFAGERGWSVDFNRSTPHVRLSIVSPMNAGAASKALLRLIVFASGAGDTFEVVYRCTSMNCQGGIFTLETNAVGFPEKLAVVSHSTYYSEVDDQGVCSQGNCVDVEWEASRPTYLSEPLRLRCCDPFCNCAPGSITIICASRGTQIFGGCNVITFCTGGRTGITSPSGPSREYCVSVIATDGSSHTICCVVYCSNGVWRSEWYCDGAFAGVGTGGAVTCCPFSFVQDMPAITCLPGCTGCVAINTDPTCVGISTIPCCDPAGLPATMTVHVYSTCWGNFTCTITNSGGTWGGSCLDGNGDDKLVSFTPGISPCVVQVTPPFKGCIPPDDGVVYATMSAVDCGANPYFTSASIAQSACVCAGMVTNVVVTL